MTARRVKDTDGGMVAGRAATVNGRAAGHSPGWVGGSMVSCPWMTNPTRARVFPTCCDNVRRWWA